MELKKPLNSHVVAPEEFARSLISINDAFAFHYRQIDKNERPYTVTVMKKNNELLEIWREKVLSRLADESGYLEAEMAAISLKVFLDGTEVIALSKECTFSEFNEPSPWFSRLENCSLEEVWEFRNITLKYALAEITKSIQMNLAGEQYNKVFCLSDDPLEWYKLSQKHRELFMGGYQAFGLGENRVKSVLEKIGTVLCTNINPYK
jgi:hypothetical protein